MDVVDTRRPSRQDTFDLREQLQQDDSPIHAHADAASSTFVGTDDEHSVLDDDSDGEEHDEYMDVDDDGSSSLSIPNESIDFDLVYSLHSFAATVEGQANVVKGDSLFLMDDSNSYWWLVRVLKTQEVGYIPAENIETPFERLARLNKHRNIDLASATQTELNEGLHASQDRLRTNLNSRTGSNHSPSPIPRGGSRAPPPKGVQFIASMYVHRYPPAIWREDEVEDPNDEWDDEAYEYQDQELAEELMQQKKQEGGPDFEPDDGVPWDESAAREMQARQMQSQTKSPSPQTSPDQADQQQRQQQQQQQLQLQQQAQQQQREQELQVQQQRDLVAQQQQIQLQRQQQLKQQQAITDQQIPQVQVQPLRPSNSRERLNGSQETASSQSNSRSIDPAQATETRKLTATPTIARDDDQSGPYLPSAILEKQREEERVKRHREEEMAEESKKKAKGKEKMPPPVSSANYAKSNAGGKLRKEQKEPEDEGKDKKKKSMFSNIFGKKKDKKDKNLSVGSVESSELTVRSSEDSSRSGSRPSLVEGVMSPTTATALQQQQQQALRASVEGRRPVQPETPERPPLNQVSQHASQLRQRDQQQQALYQQYLNRSPSSPPEAQPSYGLQSASAMGLSSYQKDIGSPSANLGPPASRPRPGSLILTPAAPDGPGVPELSVIRVFAGKNLQTEATFKTVLLNSSTTSGDLVRQALQRFRLSAGEDEGDYYLTVKQVEGGASAVLLPTEKPLVVFETLVVEAMELPKVKRSSVGSISSVASNLSMHPAIKKLPMNDFTDDSAVKFYLNRRSDDEVDDSVIGHGAEGDETLIAADMSFSESETQSPIRTTYLSVSTNHNVTPERFTSPSFRFALQLVVYPEDLPDDMAFHPYTEAIVFKDSLKDTDITSPPKVSPTMRRKVFVFAKNVTVAEVIEIGLERFGIPEGVVDGGDEVEDKMTKRRSSARVRYILAIDIGNGDRERELLPSHRVIDAFPRPPTLRAVERSSLSNKRRSVDSAQILGSVDDVNADDPVFILRRATAYRNSTSRHRMSAPLDEIALQQLHRESASSTGSDPAPPDGHEQQRQPSRQEIIARQREATRAKQSAILTAQSNSLRGMDVLLPGNAMLRSYDANDKMRYSYVEPDGETYDISDIVEEELRENHQASRDDLLEGVLGRRDVGGEKLDRVLSKIRSGKNKEKDLSSLSSVDSRRSASLSDYSADDAGAEGKREQTRSVTPGQQQQSAPRAESARQVRTPSAGLLEDRHSRPGTTTPTGKNVNTASNSRRQPSIASVMSDLSGYATAQTNPVTSPVTETSRSPANTPKPQPKRVYLPDDDFGVSRMLAIIECKGSQPKTPLPPLAPADALLFGRPVDLQSLHPQVREVYAGTFKQLEEMDKVLDDYLEKIVGGF